MTIAHVWKAREIGQMRRSIGWDCTPKYEEESAPENATDDDLLTPEDLQDIKDAVARLDDPGRTSVSLEDLKRELGF